jgi:hypothetical protein
VLRAPIVRRRIEFGRQSEARDDTPQRPASRGRNERGGAVAGAAA